MFGFLMYEETKVNVYERSLIAYYTQISDHLQRNKTS